MKTHQISLISCLLLFCALLMVNSDAFGQNSEYSRWIGTLEGNEEITPGGGAFLYDLYLVDEKSLRIEKSTGIKLIKETFPFTRTDNGIQLGNVENSTIPEFNNVEMVQVSDKRYDVTIFGSEKSSFRPSKTSYAWMQWIFLFLLVFIGNELCRKYKYFNHFLFILVPIVLTPLLWMDAGFDGWFRWVKLYSVLAMSLIIMYFRFHGGNKYNFVKIVIAGLLAINIAEAVAQDFTTHQVLNLINGIAGILNILTIAHILGMKKDTSTPHDMLWPGMTIFWILAYDIWNVTFVYINYPNTVFNTIAILAAPTIAAIWIKRGTYMQARANTLSIYMMYLFTTAVFYNETLSMQVTLPLPRNDTILYLLVGSSIFLNVALAIYYFRWKLTGKAPSKLQVGQSDSVL